MLVLLPLLSVAGAFSTLVLAKLNGTIDMVEDVLAHNSLLPETNDPLLKSYTGIRTIDSQLSTLVVFFAPILDLSGSDLSLSIWFGAGQFGAAWALMLLESVRFGNKAKIVSLYKSPIQSWSDSRYADLLTSDPVLAPLD
jgi:hypothetical protein